MTTYARLLLKILLFCVFVFYPVQSRKIALKWGVFFLFHWGDFPTLRSQSRFRCQKLLEYRNNESEKRKINNWMCDIMNSSMRQQWCRNYPVYLIFAHTPGKRRIFQSRLIILIKFLYHFDVETLIMLCLCWSEARRERSESSFMGERVMLLLYLSVMLCLWHWRWRRWVRERVDGFYLVLQ